MEHIKLKLTDEQLSVLKPIIKELEYFTVNTHETPEELEQIIIYHIPEVLLEVKTHTRSDTYTTATLIIDPEEIGIEEEDEEEQ